MKATYRKQARKREPRKRGKGKKLFPSSSASFFLMGGVWSSFILSLTCKEEERKEKREKGERKERRGKEEKREEKKG